MFGGSLDHIGPGTANDGCVGRKIRLARISSCPKPVAPSAIRAKSKTYLIKADGSGEFAETSEPRASKKVKFPGCRLCPSGEG